MKRLALIIVLLLAAATVYAVTFAPGHFSNAHVETADGEESLPLASTSSGLPEVHVVPERGWTVRPLVVDLQVPVLRDLPEPPLPRDPRLLLGVEEGVTVGSPDGVLRIALRVSEESLEDALTDLEDETGEITLREQLASGAELHHVDTNDGVRGVLDLGDARVIVTATATAAGTVRGTATATNTDTNTNIEDYRASLSALLESVELG
ncbi:hypothetical protein [Leucobacter sp. GX24907]